MDTAREETHKEETDNKSRSLPMKIAVTVQRGLNDDGDSWKPLANG